VILLSGGHFIISPFLRYLEYLYDSDDEEEEDYLAASQKTICSDAFDFLFDSRNLNPEKIEVCPLYPLNARACLDQCCSFKFSLSPHLWQQKASLSPLLSKFERKTVNLSSEIHFRRIVCRHMWRMATGFDTTGLDYAQKGPHLDSCSLWCTLHAFLAYLSFLSFMFSSPFLYNFNRCMSI
jgi:hypothetical protein